MNKTHPYYAIVTFGGATYGTRKSYYRSLDSARRDAKSLGGGSLSCIRILGAPIRKAAINADIGGNLPVVEHVR